MSTSQSQKNATNTYRQKALANISLVISHTEPEILQALEKIMAHHGISKTTAIKTALVEYAKSLD